jgi:hypothetical protein
MSRMLVCVFEREEDVLGATAAARKQGLAVAEVFSPYPIHGLSRAIGVRPSRLPLVCLLLGLGSAAAMILFQLWTTAVSWPLNVGGKPWNSLPAFVPVTFEVMVFCAGVGTTLAFLWSTGLRPGRRSSLGDLGVTDDRFVLALRTTEPDLDRTAAAALLSPFHAVKIEERDV